MKFQNLKPGQPLRSIDHRTATVVSVRPKGATLRYADGRTIDITAKGIVARWREVK